MPNEQLDSVVLRIDSWQASKKLSLSVRKLNNLFIFTNMSSSIAAYNITESSLAMPYALRNFIQAPLFHSWTAFCLAISWFICLCPLVTAIYLDEVIWTYITHVGVGHDVGTKCRVDEENINLVTMTHTVIFLQIVFCTTVARIVQM